MSVKYNIDELQMRPYLSVAEAAYLFGISQDAIRRQIAAGRIPAVNLGDRLTRINRRALEKLILQNPPPRNKARDKGSKAPKNPRGPVLEGYCTVTDIVNKYGIDQPRVSAIIKKYRLPKIRMGRYVFVPAAQADELFAQYNKLYNHYEKTVKDKSNRPPAQEHSE